MGLWFSWSNESLSSSLGSRMVSDSSHWFGKMWDLIAVRMRRSKASFIVTVPCLNRK